jgi:hypothetical protein
VRLRRCGRGSAREGLLSADRRVCPGFVPSHGAYEERNPKIERRVFFEKDRGECIGWMSRHVDVVCAKVQVHVYGGVTTVFVELQVVVRAHDLSS